MNPAGAIAGEETHDVVVARAVVRPEGPARAVAWEPVERQVTRVDRPDERLVRVVLRAQGRLPTRGPRFFAFLPKTRRGPAPRTRAPDSHPTTTPQRTPTPR